MRIDDYVTYWGRDEDKTYLGNALLPVSMRLFKTSPQYRAIVLQCCEYIRKLALAEFNDYPRPFGMSGANAAIPFNIIGLVLDRGTPNARCKILINPRVVDQSRNVHLASTNCGSLRLPFNIKVWRWNWVDVSYYDELGQERRSQFFDNTVQHEMDHNRGILVTEREVDKGRLRLK